MRKRTIRASLRNIAFETLYHQFAWAYDWVSKTFFRDQWRLWQAAALPHLRGKRVLELGPGTGVLLARLAMAGYRVVGLEKSPAMVAQSRRRLAKLGTKVGARAAVLQGSSEAIPLRSASVDSVLATFPSDYIAAETTIREIVRVLIPGGRLVIVPGGLLLPADREGKVMNKVADVVYGDQSPGAKFSTKLGAQFAAQGFTVRQTQWRNEVGVAFILIADKR